VVRGGIGVVGVIIGFKLLYGGVSIGNGVWVKVLLGGLQYA